MSSVHWVKKTVTEFCHYVTDSSLELSVFFFWLLLLRFFQHKEQTRLKLLTRLQQIFRKRAAREEV